jgi:hypothetical protein
MPWSSADEPMAVVRKVVREKIFLSYGIHCCPNFFPKTLLFYEEYVRTIWRSKAVYDYYHYYQMMVQVMNIFSANQKRWEVGCINRFRKNAF